MTAFARMIRDLDDDLLDDLRDLEPWQEDDVDDEKRRRAGESAAQFLPGWAVPR